MPLISVVFVFSLPVVRRASRVNLRPWLSVTYV
jgi:hypothetical protein